MPTANPWQDLEVIDSRAPRFSQGLFALLALLGIIFALPWIWALNAIQMLLGAFFSRKLCLPCLLYFTAVQPAWGEGVVEDARPPRLATIMGALMSLLAAATWYLVSPAAGIAICSLQIILALLSSVLDLCLGCLLYRSLARLRLDRGEEGGLPKDLLPGGGLILFSHPYCADCQVAKKDFAPDLVVDVRKDRQLAQLAGVRVVPTLLKVGKGGAIERVILP